MGKRITFRGRGRGHNVSDGATPMPGVSIVEPRVKFIKGWHTDDPDGDPEDGSVECGDGTGYVPATQAQIEEILYRVRDAEFVSGSLTAEYDGETDVGTITGTRPAALFEVESNVEFDGGAHSLRGYCTAVGVTAADDPQPMDHVPDGSLGAVYEVGDAYVPSSGENGKHKVREAADEYALWLNGYPANSNPERFIGTLEEGQFYLLALANRQYHLAAHNFLYGAAAYRTGFSLESVGNFGLLPTIYSPTVNSSNFLATGGAVELAFSGAVAWLDDDGSGNPLSGGNRLFIGLQFAFEIAGEFGLGSLITTQKSRATDSYSQVVSNQTLVDTGNFLRLRFASSPLRELAIPLYSYTADYGSGAQEGYTASTDWIFQATKWWPYATTTGDPAWDEDTGLPINGGPSS